ncbi:MAG: flagellar hook-associated protein 3 [Desulfobacteraceae bacterium]|nr:MAG: flagellar hook-associated protein 3 [Desulfobacteraceae bacterium]
MRVSQKAIFNTHQYRLEMITQELTDTSLDVATGKRINEMKDDPVGLTQVLSLKSNLSELEQTGKNISTGRTWLRAGETALTNVKDIITEATGIAVSMRNATYTGEQRLIAAEQIRGYLLQVESLSNTVVNGQYLFSGTKTDTKPFEVDDQDNPTAVTYSGNDGAFAIKTGRDTNVTVGHAGDVVFSTLFSDLINLKDALESNDTAGIGTGLDALDADFNRINSKIAEIGAREVRLDTREKVIQDLDLRYTENRAELEEIDITEAILKMQTTQLAYQAALSSSAKVMEMSLVDFL